VGVVRDVRDVALDQPPPAMVYYPFTQKPEAVFTLVVRTGHDPRLSLLAIRRQLAALDPELAVFLIRTMDELEASTLEQRRFITLLLVGFAATALGMAAIGLYGLISYSVVQRAREIGIRLALGAAPARILRLLLQEGGVLALTGGLLGLLGSFLTGRLLRGQLVGVGALDPLALCGTVALLLSVALIATLIPARRATRADPLQALREG
jgi:putative ABC transport system permease protein